MAGYTDGLDERFVNAIASTISDYLRNRADDPIKPPDANGAFPSAGRSMLFTHEPLVVVPDTMSLLNNVKTACEKDKRMILVTAANFGALRLYCAQHVVEEVYRHSQEFAAKAGVTRADYIARFEREYVPLFRLVDDVESVEHLLTDEEKARVALLRETGSKDVPSVILSIILDAHYLTRDKLAFRTAYGREQTQVEFEQQTELLKAAGDADARGQMLFYLALFPAIFLSLLGHPFGKVPPRFHWLLWTGGALSIGLLAFLAYRNRETLRPLGSGALQMLLALYAPVMEHSERIRRVGPGQPAWEVLGDEVAARSATTRAMLHVLSRSQLGTMSARELSNELPALNVGKGEAIVRELLRRRRELFHETKPGRFQVGRPLSETTILTARTLT